MSGILDPTWWWFPVGLLAFVLAGLNLVKNSLGKNKGWHVMMFLSLGCGALAVLLQYYMVYNWVKMEDWSALMDVVPSMSMVLTVAVAAGLVLNAMVLVQNLRKK